MVALLLIAAAVVACYANTLRAPFTFDDGVAIVGNTFVQRVGSADDLRRLWHWSPRRFLTDLTFAVNYRAGGLQVIGYHVGNLAIHIAAAWAVLWLALLLQQTPALQAAAPGDFGVVSGRLGLAAFAALLFAVHPIQTEAVTYVVQRAASLAALLYILALVLYARAGILRVRAVGHARLRCTLLLAACAGCFALAMLTKENAATLPAAVLLLEICFFPPPAAARGWRGVVSQRALAIAALLIIGALLAGVAVLMLGGGLAGVRQSLATGATMSRGDYLRTEINVVRTYLRLLVLPLHQNVDYDYPIAHSLWTVPTLLSAALLLALLGSAVALFRRHRLVSFGIVFFFLTLAVESTLIPLPDVIFEHRLYLPSVGVALALSAAAWAGLDLLAARPAARRLRPLCAAAMGAVILALGALTVARNALWADPIRLWADAVRQSPHKARPHHNLASHEEAAGRFEAARAEYQQALALDPKPAKTWNNMGDVEKSLGHISQAAAAYEQALRLNPHEKDDYTKLGLTYLRQGRVDDAAKTLAAGSPAAAAIAETLRASGDKALQRGALAEAEAYYRPATEVDPKSADLHDALAAVYEAEGKLDDAAAEYRRVLAINPLRADACFKLGGIYERTEHWQEAAAAYRTALRLRPGFVEAQTHLAAVERAPHDGTRTP